VKTHELAKKLLSQPNANVAIRANGHEYSTFADRDSHGRLQGAFIEETKWLSELQKHSKPETAFVIGNMLDWVFRNKSVNIIYLDEPNPREKQP